MRVISRLRTTQIQINLEGSSQMFTQPRIFHVTSTIISPMHDPPEIPDAQPFYGRGLWLDRPAGKLTLEERCDRIRSFLRGHSIHVPDDYVTVFSFCHTAAELWFVYEITCSSGWEQQGDRSLTNTIHRITIGARPCGVRIPILIEDLARGGYSIAVDIQPPKEFLPYRAARDHVRRAEIARCVDRMVGIPDHQSRRYGKNLRVDLMRQRLSLMGQSPPAPKPRRGRFWTGGMLAYDLTQVPLPERLPILTDWLRAYDRFVPTALLDALIHCNRAGELILILQLVTFQRIESRGNQVTIDNLYRITFQPRIFDWTFDFLIEPVSPLASYSRAVIEVEPATYFSRDVRAELAVAERLANAGYKLERVAADNAKFVGRQWHQRIAHDLLKRR